GRVVLIQHMSEVLLAHLPLVTAPGSQKNQSTRYCCQTCKISKLPCHFYPLARKIFRNCTAETSARKPYGRGIRGVNGTHVWGIVPFRDEEKVLAALFLRRTRRITCRLSNAP